MRLPKARGVLALTALLGLALLSGGVAEGASDQKNCQATFLFSTHCFSQELSQESVDKLVQSYLPRDARLVEILELTKTTIDDYEFRAELANVILGEYWADEHSFLCVAHDTSPKAFSNQRLGFTLFPGRVYLYTFKIKECPPEACMDKFYVFAQKDGKILGSRTTTIGYTPTW